MQSSFLPSTHNQLFTDHIPFVIFFYRYGSSKISAEIIFSEKKAILRKSKHLLENFGFVEANSTYTSCSVGLHLNSCPENN